MPGHYIINNVLEILGVITGLPGIGQYQYVTNYMIMNGLGLYNTWVHLNQGESNEIAADIFSFFSNYLDPCIIDECIEHFRISFWRQTRRFIR